MAKIGEIKILHRRIEHNQEIVVKEVMNGRNEATGIFLYKYEFNDFPYISLGTLGNRLYLFPSHKKDNTTYKTIKINTNRPELNNYKIVVSKTQNLSNFEREKPYEIKYDDECNAFYIER